MIDPRASLLSIAGLALAACGAAAPAAPPPPDRPPAPATPCSGEADQAYRPRPAPTGALPVLPAAPLPDKPIKDGDAFTVWGASHHLRSRAHHDEVDGKKITIVGYIAQTNYDAAPACAVHRTGKADPPSCKAPIPTFYIADDKADLKTMIQVMGWASNFAQVYSMIESLDGAAPGRAAEVRLADEFWGQDLPNPVPGVGARVKVTGTYGVSFAKTPEGAAADPRMGIMAADKIEYLSPPPEKVYLRGMKKRP